MRRLMAPPIPISCPPKSSLVTLSMGSSSALTKSKIINVAFKFAIMITKKIQTRGMAKRKRMFELAKGKNLIKIAPKKKPNTMDRKMLSLFICEFSI